MSHVYHEILDGYDVRQILHDGCPECEHRGEDVERALIHLDAKRFERAWKRAFDLWASDGDHAAVGQVSECEADVLHALWVLQVIFQRRGMRLDGIAPRFGYIDEVLK